MAQPDTSPTSEVTPDEHVAGVDAPELAPGDVAPDVDPSPRFYRDWRVGVTAASVLSVLVGVWLIVSPGVLTYVDGDSRLNPVIAGGLVVSLALLRAGIWRAEWLSWVTVAIGAWLFASGFWLAESSAASWNAWFFGLAVIVLGLFSIDATEEGRMEGSPDAGASPGAH